ncbi:hypothetical protein C2S52_005096 [Perilla frutescens var. hirtella]|nr:hypothetical protein C2S51_010533 [Perilla frutescens var. frutescens]KAH6794619.1 hypothetical protein C2S52_005096 [Perilla frutescens var. hirtella]
MLDNVSSGCNGAAISMAPADNTSAAETATAADMELSVVRWRKICIFLRSY